MNYKGTRITLNVGPYSITIPADASLKHLFDKTVSATVADTFIDVATNLVYSVPAGKKFVMLVYKAYSDETVTTGSIIVSTGDTEDAETATVITLPIPSAKDAHVAMYVNKSWAAGKFIVHKPSGASLDYTEAFGYEVDA